MTSKREKRLCSKCGKSLSQYDTLPLCPTCLFGLEDLTGMQKVKYPSMLAGDNVLERLTNRGPSPNATGR